MVMSNNPRQSGFTRYTPDALQFIKSGDMRLTVFQDAKGQGDGAVQSAIGLVKGEKVAKDTFIPYQLITKENVSQFANSNTR